ncbi:MAG: cupin domain-containing protein [Synergistaceae bacterium]|nr:cupin domain-containing protein [Synergistaceae bacterium]
MKVYSVSSEEKFVKRPGMTGTFVHGEGLTFSHWVLEKDAVLALHEHEHAQITYVVSGKLRLESGGREVTAESGDFVVFAPGEPHSGLALEKTVALDAFSPAREDFKREMNWRE